MSDSLNRTLQLIESRTGLAVSGLLRADVSQIIARLSGGNLESWLRVLETSAEDAPAWQTLMAAFAIGETYFMRDPQHFKLLQETILPPLILRRRQAHHLRLDVLSVGCSTGEEIYSLAILLNEFLPDIARWTITLTGMDMNAAALAQAQRGVYRLWSFRHVNDTFMRRYFVPQNENYVLRSEIVERVTFVRGNIADPPPMPLFDLVFCRNVLLYFTPRHVQIAEDTLYRVLKPDGWLVLGSAEALRSRRERWQMSPYPNAPFYQKTRHQPTQPLRLAVTPLPPPAPPVETGQAAEVLRAGNDTVTEPLLRQMLAEQPHDAHVHTLLAFLLANRKAYAEAQTCLDAALHIEPTLSDAHYLRATIYNEQNDLLSAERALQAALYYQRDHLPALLLTGMLLLQRGDMPRAHKTWERARAYAADRSADDLLSDVSEMSIGRMRGILALQLDE